MIVSASRRTDIPAFFTEWFFLRWREGWVLVRNPMNPHRISRISLTPSTVDAIVFWTKNPTPLVNRLNELGDVPFYFQFTVTGYDSQWEVNVPPKEEVIVPVFKRLANTIGPERIIWRFDPILMTKRYTPEYHHENFERLARLLSGYTTTCSISFLVEYPKIARTIREYGVRTPTDDEKRSLAESLARTGKQYGIKVRACAENLDLRDQGVEPAQCIDRTLLESLTGTQLKLARDSGQRSCCHCVSSIDIGTYNTCRHFCRYCYANYSRQSVDKALAQHDPTSPLLFGQVEENDIVTDRACFSCKNSTPLLF